MCLYPRPRRALPRCSGVPIGQFSAAEWAGAIAYVPQEPVLFAGQTIAENIAFGAPGATREQVEAAARDANAHEFIEKLAKGYDTPVAANGLSGGQRQRVAIARAFLRDAPILILDEATSALDAVSEAKVQAAIARLAVGRTVLVIAHRLSTVKARPGGLFPVSSRPLSTRCVSSIMPVDVFDMTVSLPCMLASRSRRIRSRC